MNKLKGNKLYLSDKYRIKFASNSTSAYGSEYHLQKKNKFFWKQLSWVYAHDYAEMGTVFKELINRARVNLNKFPFYGNYDSEKINTIKELKLLKLDMKIFGMDETKNTRKVKPAPKKGKLDIAEIRKAIDKVKNKENDGEPTKRK